LKSFFQIFKIKKKPIAVDALIKSIQWHHSLADLIWPDGIPLSFIFAAFCWQNKKDKNVRCCWIPTEAEIIANEKFQLGQAGKSAQN